MRFFSLHIPDTIDRKRVVGGGQGRFLGDILRDDDPEGRTDVAPKIVQEAEYQLALPMADDREHQFAAIGH